jgi:hypothetical protein
MDSTNASEAKPGSIPMVVVPDLPSCDFHLLGRMQQVPSRYGCRTVFGDWAFLCVECFQQYGVGLGAGRGQILLKPGEL